MKNITVLPEKRKGKEKFKDEELAAYSTRNFGMYHGEEKDVRIAFKNEMVGVIIDRFGKNITIHPSKQDGWSETVVKVAVSRQFFGWIFALGTDVNVIGPKEVTKLFEEEMEERAKLIRVKY